MSETLSLCPWESKSSDHYVIHFGRTTKNVHKASSNLPLPHAKRTTGSDEKRSSPPPTLPRLIMRIRN